MTGLVFAKLYFPNSDPLTGTLQAFGIYAVGFAARPVGAAIFGHYGDRMGRKAALIATLLLMGLATFAVAFVPTYDQIGIWGAVILTVLRFIQGVGVGGEWGGSVLLSMEWARSNKNRGLIASWPQFGVPAGLFLANLAVLAFSAYSGDQFLTWGWRAPFLISIVLVAIGLWIRLGILETPTFSKLVAEKKIFAGSVYRGLGAIPETGDPFGAGADGGTDPVLSLHGFRLYLWHDGAQRLTGSHSRRRADGIGSIVLRHPFQRLPFRPYRKTTHVHDRRGHGRHLRLHLLRASQHHRPGLDVYLAIVLSLVPHAMMYGPQAALIAESFPPVSAIAAPLSATSLPPS